MRGENTLELYYVPNCYVSEGVEWIIIPVLRWTNSSHTFLNAVSVRGGVLRLSYGD
jgi:hypothetical protein